MNKYRRIEVNAFRRRVTIVSGEWLGDIVELRPTETPHDLSLNDGYSCQPVEPDSPEGQTILVEVMRSLAERLSPEARSSIRADQNTVGYRRLYLKLRSFNHHLWPRVLQLARRDR